MGNMIDMTSTTEEKTVDIINGIKVSKRVTTSVRITDGKKKIIKEERREPTREADQIASVNVTTNYHTPDIIIPSSYMEPSELFGKVLVKEVANITYYFDDGSTETAIITREEKIE